MPQCDLSGIQREGASAGPWHALGSPVSVVTDNLVMENVKQRALATFHFPSQFWKHYVDDIFTVLPCSLVQKFLSHLNSIEADIQFTFENGQLPFLNVCLRRESDGSITTSVHHPVAHKASVMRTLMN